MIVRVLGFASILLVGCAQNVSPVDANTASPPPVSYVRVGEFGPDARDAFPQLGQTAWVAAFFATTPSHVVVEGACDVQAAVPSSGVSVGTLRVESTRGEWSVPWAPSGYILSMPAPQWTVGEVLRVSSSGSDAGVLDAMVVYPPAVDVTDPALPMAGSRLRVRRDTGLRVRWRGSPPAVRVTLDLIPLTSRVTCTFAGADGGGLVPPSILSTIAAVGDNSMIEIDSIDTRTIVVNGVQVEVAAQHGAFRSLLQLE